MKENIALFQIRLCIWFPLVVYETICMSSLLFIQGYTSTGNNRVIHLFFFGFRKKKKKRKKKKEKEKGRKRNREGEERRNIQKDNRYNNFNH